MNFFKSYIHSYIHSVGVEELIALPTVEGVWQGPPPPPPLEEGEIPPSPPTPPSPPPDEEAEKDESESDPEEFIVKAEPQIYYGPVGPPRRLSDVSLLM